MTADQTVLLRDETLQTGLHSRLRGPYLGVVYLGLKV